MSAKAAILLFALCATGSPNLVYAQQGPVPDHAVVVRAFSELRDHLIEVTPNFQARGVTLQFIGRVDPPAWNDVENAVDVVFGERGRAAAELARDSRCPENPGRIPVGCPENNRSVVVYITIIPDGPAGTVATVHADLTWRDAPTQSAESTGGEAILFRLTRDDQGRVVRSGPIMTLTPRAPAATTK
jgi:hypothetical protein